jgi:hypothetical protein
MSATEKIFNKNSSLYQEDFYLWVQTTAKLLREKRFNEIDLESLVDEVETLGRSERKAIRSNLKVLLMHLLKYQYQAEKPSKSWNYTIIEHRNRLKDDLKDSPSLKPYLQEVFAEVYQDARLEAAAETNLPLKTFPQESPFTPEETLNLEFFPK